MNLSFLRPVYEHSGPFVSAYLNVSRDAEDADQAIAVRWHDARQKLAEQGAEEPTLRAMDAVVGRGKGESGPFGQIVFATGGSVVFDQLVADPPQDQAAGLGPLPDPLPYLARRGQHVPHVLAVVNSVGGDISAVDMAGVRHTTHVEGDDYPVHKPKGGQDAQKQMQRAVDQQVGHNASRVANEVQHLAVGGGAEVIMLAGDVDARQALAHQLAHGLQGEVVEAESGSRAAGSSSSPLDSELHQALDRRAQQEVRRVADSFEEGRGNADRAVEGLADVVHALQRGQVATVLWSQDDTDRDEEVWIGPSAEHVGMSEQELTTLGVERPVRAHAGAAVIRAAAATSADLVLVPEATARLDGGIGALLRFNDPTLTG